MVNKNEQIKSLPLPPGSFGLPFIGETISFLKNVNKFPKRRFQKYGNIFKTKIFGQPCIYIKGAEANRFFLTSKNIEITLPPNTKTLLGDSIGNQIGDIHKSRRQIIAKSFQTRNLEAYFDSMVKITEDYLNKWQQKVQFTWYSELKNYTFDVATKFLIGLDQASDTSLKPLYNNYEDGLFSLNPLRLPWTKFGQAAKSRQQLLIEIQKVIEKRQQESKINSDALSILLQEKDEKGEHLSIGELKDQILNLLFAGHSTLTSALTSFCLLMAQHPTVLVKAKEEQDQFPNPLTKEQLNKMPYLEQVLQEVLRLNPPIVGGFRKILSDCEFQGYRIPKGWNLMYQIKETHEDVKIYPQPDKFDPERFVLDKKNKTFSYIPFSGGMRECLGKEFAKLEMKILATLLIRNYHWSLIPDQNLELVSNPITKPKDGLKVIFRKN